MKLNEKAMLVGIGFSRWTGKTMDRNVSVEVLNSKGASDGGGNWWTHLIPKKDMRKITTAYNRCKKVHSEMTLPWSDNGLRVLPASMFMEYRKAIQECVEEFDSAVEDFLKTYPKLKQNAHSRLGDLLKGKVLPTTSELRCKFGVRQEILPIPSVQDFRIDLSDADIDEVKQQITETLSDATSKAVAGVWDRLAELVDKIGSTLKKPDKIFRDSLIKNLADFCKLIPKFNMTNDESLEKMRQEIIQSLTKLDPQDLRESKGKRKKAAKSAKTLIKKMEDMGY